MDYEQYALNSYTIPSNQLDTDTFVFFYSDGQYSIETDTGFDNAYDNLEGLYYFGSNYYNRFLVGEHTNLISFAYCFNNRDLLFCNTNRLDYLVLGSSGATGGLRGVRFKEGDTLDDLSTVSNYYNPSGENPFSDYEDEGILYQGYNINLTAQKQYGVFDYYNIKYSEGVSPYLVVRGENMTFYDYAVELSYLSVPNNYYFSYGAPFYTAREQGYSNGYSNGFTAGWVQGNDNGYQIGINQNANIGQQSATAFDFIGSGFTAVKTVLDIEILPNITLGLCFSIPLVFTLIMVIFKLVRK